MNSILPRILPILILAALALILVTCANQNGVRVDQRTLVNQKKFVYVAEAVPGVVIDLRYAQRKNVASKRLYPADMPCLLHRDTAAKLLVAQRIVERKGFRLKIWDAWRPPSSHMALWYSNPNPDYVAPPENGLSFHCSGIAVDVTLTDANGVEVIMPSAFDEFSPKAWSQYKGLNATIRNNISVLQSAMKQAGFSGIDSEWWHYLDEDAVASGPVFVDDIGLQLPVKHLKFMLNVR